ncbi:MBL fold metallo-hydrolase [Eggerthella sinensis]|uniref:MBL fold metallo-hydrolase n=1 Tax=Eggerthella sinensis TaxID=242230 RepID=UPI001D06B176|nr:MBL fold metallo-hydrolase [Eggerthella sinensis]MCB7037430.1 MBL fold metallo-hydrolase [Eggerthella sinensis]
MTGHTFTFMGTGAGCGVPAFFCACPACEEARRVPRARRGDCGVMVRGERTVLIDTPPDIRHQLVREQVRTVDELLFTHAHFDHVGGLGELEYFVRLKLGHPLPAYGSDNTLAGIQREFHYLADCLAPSSLQPYATVVLDGVRYTALPVTHAPGTYGFLIETDDVRLFYASDTGMLPPETAERVRGVDAMALDATFWKRTWSPQTHHSVQEAIEEGLALGVGTLYLTHLAMHYDEPVTLAQLEEYLQPYEGRVQAAYDGLTLDLTRSGTRPPNS